MNVEYTLTASSTQMNEILKAVELLMRLKLGQYQELVYVLGDVNNPLDSGKLSDVDTLLKQAFKVLNQNKPVKEYKDVEWHQLYDLYQVLRKAVHDAEHPDGKDLDASEPMQFGEEPLMKVKWKTRR